MAIVPIMISPAKMAEAKQSTTQSLEPARAMDTELTASLDSVTLSTTASVSAPSITSLPETASVSGPSSSAAPVKVPRGTTVKMSIPLDTISENSGPRPRHPTLLHRDSLERRESFLKGKEGSRQRRRWENDRLLSNPWAEPPLPSDWEVRPTYPRRTIPYYLAPLWDAAEFQRAIESKLKGNRRNSVRQRRSKKAGSAVAGVYALGMSPMEEAATMIPKEVRARLKHARSAKGLLQDLEEDVRGFVKRWNEREMKARSEGLEDAPVAGAVSDEEDEEIVFVGRNGAMHDTPSTPEKKTKGHSKKEGDVSMGEAAAVAEHESPETGVLEKEKLVFEGLEGDKGAAFGRWLVHCVGNYYGLKTWSVTREIEGEQRREAYVGVDSRVRGWMGRGVEVGREVELPRPLWCMV